LLVQKSLLDVLLNFNINRSSNIVKNPETKETGKVFTALMITEIPWKASTDI
jgi:hypothetical protein